MAAFFRNNLTAVPIKSLLVDLFITKQKSEVNAPYKNILHDKTRVF